MEREIPVFVDSFVIEGHEVDPEIEFGVGNTAKPADQRKLARGLNEVSEAMRAGTMSDDEIIAALTSLKVSRDTPVSTLRRHTGLLKIKSAAEFIKDKLDNYVENMVVFAIHKDVIFGLADALHLYNPVTIFGGMKQSKKDSKILRFERGRSRVAICNIAAAGTAIRFKASQYCTVVEPDWNPANNAQAISRCLWLEREGPLPVTYLSLADSYDEHVNRVLVRKTRIENTLFS